MPSLCRLWPESATLETLKTQLFVGEVAVGKSHAMLLTDEGVIYSWTAWHDDLRWHVSIVIGTWLETCA